MLLVVAVLAALLAPSTVSAVAATSPPRGAAPALQSVAVAAPLQRTESLPVLVELDAVDPAVQGPGVPFVIRGTVHNLSPGPVPVREIRAATTYRSLDSRAAVQAWSTGSAGVTPSRVLGVDPLGGDDLAPGESRSFYIRMDGESLDPPFGFATLPLAVEVIADDGTVRGRLRSYLPWYAAAPADPPLNLSWVVPLTVPAQPELTAADPGVRDAAWLRVIGPQSPARVWLEGLSDQRATFVVDPALLTPLPPVGEVTDPVPAPLPTPTATDPPESTPTQPALPEQTPEQPPESTSPLTRERGPEPTTTDADDAACCPPAGTPSTGSGITATPSPSDPTPTDPTPPTLPGVELPEVLTEVQQAQIDVQTRLSGLERDRVWWLPAGDPDLAALLDLQASPALLGQLVPGVASKSPLVAGQLIEVGRHDVAWPTWSRVNQRDLAALAQQWPPQEQPLAGVIVPDTSVQAQDPTGTTGGALLIPVGAAESGSGDLTLLAYDTTLSGLVAAAPGPKRDGAVIQRLVAETLAIYQQAPARPRTVLLAPPRQSAIDPRTLSDLTAALDRAPWLAQTDTTETVAAPGAAALTGTPLPQAAPGDRTAYPVPRRSALSAGRLSDIETLRTTLQEISAILPSDQAVQRWQPVLDGLYSTRWRARPDSWSTALTELERQVEQVQGGVRVNPTTVNFLADEGLIQMTVVNTLPTDVQDLVLHLEPGNGRLRIVESPAPIAIGARSRATVQFRARAVAAGEVPVRAYLTTPSGLQIGAQEELTVRVRPTGEWIYWVLGGVAGVILILGLARAVRRPGAAGRAQTPRPEVMP